MSAALRRLPSRLCRPRMPWSTPPPSTGCAPRSEAASPPPQRRGDCSAHRSCGARLVSAAADSSPRGPPWTRPLHPGPTSQAGEQRWRRFSLCSAGMCPAFCVRCCPAAGWVRLPPAVSAPASVAPAAYHGSPAHRHHSVAITPSPSHHGFSTCCPACVHACMFYTWKVIEAWPRQGTPTTWYQVNNSLSSNER